MQITIKGKNVDVTGSLKDYTKKKIEKITRYFDHIISADVVFSVERQKHIVEVNINVNGDAIRGEEKTGDMYSSVDKVVEKLEKQIKKRKEKYLKKHKVDSIRVKAPIIEEVDFDEDIVDEMPAEIVKVKKFNLGKPMTVAEAIKESEELGYDFFVFLNASNSRVNVIYTRKQGYGLIDPVA